jgi:hypothetical protein
MSKYLKKITTTFNSDVHDTTVFNNNDKLFTPTLRHATLASEGFYEAPSSFQSDAIFNSIINTTSIWSFYENGNSFGSLGVGMRTIETKYEVVSAVEAVAILTVDGQITESRDIITSLHSYALSVSAGGSTTTLSGTSSTRGAVGYLQASCFTGNLTVLAKIQHSSGGAFTDLITFVNATGTNGQKVITTSTAIKKNVKAIWTVGGGPGVAAFNIGFHRN